jgi:hypothetical protein
MELVRAEMEGKMTGEVEQKLSRSVIRSNDGF